MNHSFAPGRSLLTIWRGYLALGGAVPALVISLLLRPFGVGWMLAVGIWLTLFLILFCFYLPLCFDRKSFALERDSVSVSGGVLYRYSHSLPLRSIQYVTLMSGPLERLMKVCTVIVVAPGGRVVLSGLGREDGAKLVDVLAEAAGKRA